MKKMKKIFSIIIISLITTTAFTQEKEITWHTDMNEAINKSLQTEKPLFFSLLVVIGVDGVLNYKKLYLKSLNLKNGLKKMSY